MSEKVEYVLHAKDEASAVLANVLRQFQGIDSTLSKISSVSSGAGALGRIAGGIGAVIGTTAGIVAMGNSVADAVEQLDRLHATTGVGIDRMQVLRRVIEDGGGDFEGFSTNLVKLNRALKEGDPLLEKAGVTSRDTFTAFMQVARAVANSTDAKERDAIATGLLGRSGAELIPDLQNIIEKFDAMYEAMSRSGELMGGAMVEQARSLDTQMEALSRNWAAALTRMKSVTVPVAAGIVSAFNDIADAMSGKIQNPDIESTARRLAEAESAVRTLLAEQNERGADWKANDLQMWLRTAESLRQELARLTGVDLELQRLRSRLEPGNAAGARTEGGSPDLKTGARGRRATLADYTAARGASVLANFNFAEGTDLTMEEVQNAEAALRTIVRGMEEVEVAALKFGETGQWVAEVSEAADIATSRMRVGVASDIDAMVSQVIRGTDNIRVVFDMLTTSILQDIAEAAARFGIGLGIEILSNVPGLGWLAPVGSAVAGTKGAKNQKPSSALAPAGGDTYYISTLNAKDLIREITSPTGQIRRANDRIRDVALAQRR